jgi:hypothetical protein
VTRLYGRVENFDVEYSISKQPCSMFSSLNQLQRKFITSIIEHKVKVFAGMRFVIMGNPLLTLVVHSRGFSQTIRLRLHLEKFSDNGSILCEIKRSTIKDRSIYDHSPCCYRMRETSNGR